MSDKFARVLTGLAVLAVAVIAAAVSFAHIDALALSHGYTRGTARLLPLSVDGLIVASSMVLLTEARAQRRAPRLARFGLVLGIAGTLAANVAYGVHYGPVGALVNAWPAAAFITATEILVGQMRRAGTTPATRAENLTVSDADAAVDDVFEDVAVVVPEITPEDATAITVHNPLVAVAETVSRMPGHKRPAAKAKRVERVFAAELERGELPSLREVMRRMSVGQPRARIIRDELAQIVDEAQPEAALQTDME